MSLKRKACSPLRETRPNLLRNHFPHIQEYKPLIFYRKLNNYVLSSGISPDYCKIIIFKQSISCKDINDMYITLVKIIRILNKQFPMLYSFLPQLESCSIQELVGFIKRIEPIEINYSSS